MYAGGGGGGGGGVHLWHSSQGWYAHCAWDITTRQLALRVLGHVTRQSADIATITAAVKMANASPTSSNWNKRWRQITREGC